MEKQVKYQGLNAEQVVRNREEYGNNLLTPPAKTPVWKLFLEKFKDPIIRILLIALLLSLGVAFYQYWTGTADATVFLEPVGIFVAVILATCIGFYFELSANRKFDILNQVNDDIAVRVYRDGHFQEIPRKDVVKGDILVLETGDEIPADALLMESVSLQINESTLTGEPVVKKTTVTEDFDQEATYPSNQVFKGTTVVEGRGIAEVFAVGDSTEYGKVYTGSQIENNVETPLQKQLDKLGKLITVIGYLVAALIIVGRCILYFSTHTGPYDFLEVGRFLLNTLMLAVTVIVVTVPEGLPMSVTLSLAMSMKRMLSAQNLVRKMHACETMGACTVICTDKTGTLTQNQMRVHETRFFALSSQDTLLKAEESLSERDRELARIIIENMGCNTTAFLEKEGDKCRVLGNPTEGALLLHLESMGISYEKIRENSTVIEQLPFSTERKYMATLVYSEKLGKKLLLVKGAPEILLELSDRIIVRGEPVRVEDFQPELEQILLGYQNQAMRTLALAYMEVEEGVEYIKDKKLYNPQLQYLGVVAISDPVRSDVPLAISECLKAGIDVKIVTGDTSATAKEIGRQVGLWTSDCNDRNHITGVEFAALSDAELLERVLDLKIISRARPMDKERLVKALQAKDQVVAVTGDGTNDAPALNAAQVGLSMGDGTSVAKEASDITILDNSFTSINRAVMWGRSLYQNVQRFILFQMTINLIACLIVLIGAFLGAESPLTVTQMLWVNLIMDTFAAMALASLPPSERVMQDKPRKVNDHIIEKSMRKKILGSGILFLLVLFGLMQYFKYETIFSLTQFDFSTFLHDYFRFDAGGNGFSTYEKSLFFTIFVILQFWNMFNAKAYKTGTSAFKGLSKCLGGFLSVGILIVVGQWCIVTFGGTMFNVTPLCWQDWMIILAGTSPVLWIGELNRYIYSLSHEKHH